MSGAEPRSLAERMAHLYAGASDRCHYIADFTNLTLEASGKRVPKYCRIDGPALPSAFDDHLAGRKGLLLVPVTPAGLASWAVADLDEYPLDLPGLAERIERTRLPLIPSYSKSQGGHLTWFAHRVLRADELRGRMVEFVSNFALKKVPEIFPKQDRLGPDEWGAGINLPYFRGDTAENYAIDFSGQRLSVEQWLSWAETLTERSAEQSAPGTADVESAAELLARHWTDGKRDNLNLALIGALLRKGVDAGEIENLIARTQDIGDDHQAHKSVASVERDIDADSASLDCRS